ncbi:phage NrS-1 polymerase family protein [Limnoglobus roseus]|nr:hypothetical protein [Limnoglobus roseus]
MSQAIEACERFDLEGIGLSLTTELELVAIDLDGCRNPSTGEPTPEAAAILQIFRKTFAYVTPSEEGYRIICRGRLPEGYSHLHRAGGEVYATKQYIAVTGWLVEGHPSTVAECAGEMEEFARLYMVRDERKASSKQHASKSSTKAQANREIPDTLESATGLTRTDEDVLYFCLNQPTTGTRFRALWEGNCQSWYASPSQADQALCNLLYFASGGDAVQTERLFRQSKLGQRGKATARSDYIPRTVSAAAKYVRKVYTGAATVSRPRAAPPQGVTKPPQPTCDVKVCAKRRAKYNQVLVLMFNCRGDYSRKFSLSCRQVAEDTGIPYRTCARILKQIVVDGHFKQVRRGLWATGMASEYDLPEFVPASFQDASGGVAEVEAAPTHKTQKKHKDKKHGKKDPLPLEPLTLPPRNRIQEGERTSVWIKQEPGRPWICHCLQRSEKNAAGDWDHRRWISQVESETRFAAYRVIGWMLSTRGVGSMSIAGHPMLKDEDITTSLDERLRVELQRHADEPAVYEDVETSNPCG